MVKVEMLNNTLKQIPALDKFVQGWAIFSPRITGLFSNLERRALIYKRGPPQTWR